MVDRTVRVELLLRRQSAVGTTTVASTCTLTVALLCGGRLLRRGSEAEPRHRVQPVDVLRVKREYRQVRRVRRRNRRSASGVRRGWLSRRRRRRRRRRPTRSTRESIRARSRARRARLHRRPRQSRCLSERRCFSALYQLYLFDLLICIIWNSTLYFSFFFNSTSYFLFLFLSMSIRTTSTIIVITFQSSCPPPIYFLISIQWRTAEHYSGSTHSTFVFIIISLIFLQAKAQYHYPLHLVMHCLLYFWRRCRASFPEKRGVF